MVTRNAISAPTGAAGTIYTGQGVGSRPTWVTSASGDVTAAANLTDNAVIRGDGGAKGVQTSTMVIDDNGQMLNPSQPAFLAIMSASRLNVTGNGAYYLPIAFDVEIYDQNSDYDNGTYTFTAPVTGIYQFNSMAEYSQASGVTACVTMFYSTSLNYSALQQSAPVDSNNNFGFTGSFELDMDAGDFLRVFAYSYGIGQTVDITWVSSSDPRTWFSGYLIC